MLTLLWLIPTLPLAGFLTLVLGGRRWARPAVAVIGVGSVGLSALTAIVVGLSFMLSPPPGHGYTQTLWTWMDVAGFTPHIAFRLDALALVMAVVVSGVSLLIHWYSAEYMIEEEGYGRFFAYMNLFVCSMLILVLADNLLLLYLGWEGVGLCSYLLIGFWYKDPVNGRAAQKAFIVTRIGDAAMAIGLFLLFTHLGTLQIQQLLHRAGQQWPAGSGLAVAAAALLLGGAVGKSAQLPLQTWLPDAMAGPTPVSALIHAATMVTAGVYLIARMNVLFTLAPVVQSAVAVLGALTLLLAGFSALVQVDIKRVLAYSTISQIGYMFLALGVGAWSAAIFHLMIHAFFKALLFLAAGVVILRLHHEQNMFKMGGLRRELPAVFWTFLIGSASLSAVPLITAGFYSKDLILWQAWSSPAGGPWLFAAGLVGAFLTSIYTFRMFFLTFCGEPQPQLKQSSPLPRTGTTLAAPLIILAVLSVVGGFVEMPETLGNRPLFSSFLGSVRPAVHAAGGGSAAELTLQIISAAVSLAGIYLAYTLFLRQRAYTESLARASYLVPLHRFWSAGWGFDWLYDRLFVRPLIWFARVDKDDFVDSFYDGIAWLSERCHRLLSRTQNGRVRWYAMGISAGAVIAVAIVVWS